MGFENVQELLDALDNMDVEMFKKKLDGTPKRMIRQAAKKMTEVQVERYLEIANAIQIIIVLAGINDAYRSTPKDKEGKVEIKYKRMFGLFLKGRPMEKLFNFASNSLVKTAYTAMTLGLRKTLSEYAIELYPAKYQGIDWKI